MWEKMIVRMAEVECQRKCQNNKISEIRKCIPLSINFRTRCLKLWLSLSSRPCAGHRVCSQIQTGPGSRADPVASTGLARQTFAVVGTQRQKNIRQEGGKLFQSSLLIRWSAFSCKTNGLSKVWREEGGTTSKSQKIGSQEQQVLVLWPRPKQKQN